MANPFLRDVAIKKESKLVGIVQTLAIILTFLVLFYIFLIDFNQVDGPSMQPNFLSRQNVFASKLHIMLSGTDIGRSLGFDLQRGDVVIFKNGSESKHIIKRVIGLPAEEVAIKGGVFYINGQALYENYEIISDDDLTNEFLEDGGDEVVLSNEEYFLAGDNRPASVDSRDIGPINKKDIIGKVFIRVWPLNNFGLIGRGGFREI